jgi:hypothetical protein
LQFGEESVDAAQGNDERHRVPSKSA